MTCKDAINSDTSSEDKKWHPLNQIRRSDKFFRFDLEGTADHQQVRSPSGSIPS